MPAMRADIQLLRAWAVVLVVWHHAQFGGMPAGFLGVDIFFVISGYLITGMIQQGLTQGTFSFAVFYLRRAKRLLPAACVTAMLTGCVSAWVLEPTERADLWAQLLGVVSFSANGVLWRQAGYFDGAAELKPLLHMWSLSLEEQYYMVLPGLLLACPPAWRRVGVLLGVVASAGLCAWMMQRWPSAAFYGLPTRAWELGLGSLAALWPAADVQRWQPMLRWWRWPAVAVLVAAPMHPLGTAHPGLDAVVVTLATALVLLNRFHLARVWTPGVRLGDASYAVYLVHWPLLALLNNASLQTPDVRWRWAAVGGSLVLGWALHRGVEQPLRRWPLVPGRSALGWALGASAVTLVVPGAMLLWPSASVSSLATLRAPNVGFAAVCDQHQSPYRPLPACQDQPLPRTLVWGDSFGMHLIPALAGMIPGGVAQATRSTCSPLLDLAPMDDRDHPLSWAKDCVAFNRSVLDALAQAPHIDVVMVSSPFMHLLVPQDVGRRWQVLDTQGPGPAVVRAPAAELVQTALVRTVARLRQLGKRVVIVAPPPWTHVDSSRCQVRQQLGLWTLDSAAAGLGPDCSLNEADSRRQQAPVLDMLAQVAQAASVPVFDFHARLCQNGRCMTAWAGQGLYRDARHLSYIGAKTLGQQEGLGQQWRAMAR